MYDCVCTQVHSGFIWRLLQNCEQRKSYCDALLWEHENGYVRVIHLLSVCVVHSPANSAKHYLQKARL